MTRLKVDQACLAAQVQQQIAQRLNAELAVSCPDCGAEAGRACQGDFGRSVVTHLARAVASMRRDTEPCPPPSFDGAFQRNLHAELDAARVVESYESLALECPFCAADAGQGCRNNFGERRAPHRARTAALRDRKTPTASACAPSPAASAPDADETVLPRAGGDSGRPPTAFPPKLCHGCSKELRSGTKVFSRHPFGASTGFGVPFCGDCAAELDRGDHYVSSKVLDCRIAETREPERVQCAWSSPDSEGEDW